MINCPDNLKNLVSSGKMVVCYFFEKIPYGRKKCQAKIVLKVEAFILR
jgi:hypothetical protein